MQRVVCRRAQVSDVDAVMTLVSDDTAGYRQKWGHINIEHTIENRCARESPSSPWVGYGLPPQHPHPCLASTSR